MRKLKIIFNKKVIKLFIGCIFVLSILCFVIFCVFVGFFFVGEGALKKNLDVLYG